MASIVNFYLVNLFIYWFFQKKIQASKIWEMWEITSLTSTSATKVWCEKFFNGGLNWRPKNCKLQSCWYNMPKSLKTCNIRIFTYANLSVFNCLVNCIWTVLRASRNFRTGKLKKKKKKLFGSPKKGKSERSNDWQA